MRIVFVRHGEPNYEKDCLTQKGILQAKAAAERLLEEGIEEIYSSPMGRARETARETASLLQIPEVHVLEFMHELRWGSMDGSPLFSDGHPWEIADELVRTGVDLSDREWAAHPLYRNNYVTDCVSYVGRMTDEWLGSLGYEREGFAYRNRREDDTQHTVALFSHGGSSTAVFSHILNLQFPYVCATLHLPFTGITVLRFDRRPGSLSVPCVELAGDGRHLGEAQS